ncbi:hypothetical protein FACS1894111_05400 [Clostridia bacterium]|nr:hypothetical protein FACS1894111_05400 [Clostridia bacterium]
MIHYDKPIIVAAEDVAEGVFMASGATEEAQFTVYVKKYSSNYATYTITNMTDSTSFSTVKAALAPLLPTYVPGTNIPENVNDYVFRLNASETGTGNNKHFFGGTPINDSQTLGEIGISGGATIYLVYKNFK